MESALSKGGVAMNRKTIKISEKRQITIPQKYYEKLGFTNEAECLMRGNEIVLRPVKTVSGGEFAEQILADLIAKGLSNDELLAAFKAEQKKVRPAVETMLADAENAAKGSSEYSTYDDVFGVRE